MDIIETIIWLINGSMLMCGILFSIGLIILGVPFLLLSMFGALKNNGKGEEQCQTE